MLASELVARGHSVRATTRRPERLAAIEAAGAEAVVGDPDRVATLMGVLEHVSVAFVLLGSAAGSNEQLRALHGTRLEMLLTRVLDSPVRGVLYETRGSVPAPVLRAGGHVVRFRCERSRIPYALLEAAPSPVNGWARSAADAVERLLAG